MERSQDTLALTGRILIAALFLWSGFGKLTGFSGNVGYATSLGLPMPQVLIAVSILLELGGGIALVLGWNTRWVALLFALWLIPVTLAGHPFWSAPEAQVMAQKINFMKNVAIFGGLLVLGAFGPGRYSVGGGRALA